MTIQKEPQGIELQVVQPHIRFQALGLGSRFVRLRAACVGLSDLGRVALLHVKVPLPYKPYPHLPKPTFLKGPYKFRIRVYNTEATEK